MKRTVSLWLVLALVLSLAGCGGSGEAVTETAAQTAVTVAETELLTEATTEATTEPTLSPEEVLYNALTERQKTAVDLGIVELSQMEDLEKECTIEEAARMLQRAYMLHNGTESKLMADVMTLECAQEPAYLGWIGRLPAALYVEAIEPEKYQDYEQWMKYGVDLTKNGGMFNMVNPYRGAEGYSYLKDNDDILVRHSYGWFDIGWSTGMGSYLYRNMSEGNALLDSCEGQGGLLAYSTTLYDCTTGYKVVEVNLYDEILVEKILTVEDMVEMALRMYYAFHPNADLAPYEECVTADPSVLTEELLNRSTTLPDATCSNLPAQWHGVTLDEMALVNHDGVADVGQFDAEIYEYEIQAIKDAGFNYIGLQLDFSWLQGGSKHFRKDPLDGQLDRSRLEKLDQILAWCMERDIHLDIRCTGAGGMIPGEQEFWKASDKTAVEFAKIWSVLAQRYAEVPNAYLSFTVQDAVWINHYIRFAANGLGGLKPQKELVAFVKPSVEAIREATPDRCIILDLTTANVGTEVLELKVALSADLISIENEFMRPTEKQVLDPNYYLNMQWPCSETSNAEALLHEDQYWEADSTVLHVIELAKENGLGFMFGGWGRMQKQYGAYYCSTRYPDETYEAFFTDMTETMQRYGYGWCYEEWYGLGGITYSAPALKNAAYEQLGEYPMYYDTAMLAFFKEINGVA